MFRSLITSLALVLLTGAMFHASMAPPLAVSGNAAEAPIQPRIDEPYPIDSAAERQLLELANHARNEAGLPPLEADEGLAKAARAHAGIMAAQQQLSHQFAGEPPLAQRLAANSDLHLDLAGENVAFASSVQQAEENLLHSPTHRANLLNATYNVAGFGIVHGGAVIYVVQDFGHDLPTHSAQQSVDLIAAGVNQARAKMKLPLLQRTDDNLAQRTACSMAQANSLNTPAPPGHYILRYTTMQPEALPSAGVKTIGDKNLRSFAVGACYSHSSTYPNGVYWVSLLLY
jgi:uncharacterized protein YkwD